MSNVIVNTSLATVNVTVSDINGNLISNNVATEKPPEITVVETSSQSMSRIMSGFAPQSSVVVGQPGEIRWDNNYLYLCIGTNSWKRTLLSEF